MLPSVTKPFAFTVTRLYVPAVTPEGANVNAEVTFAEPSKETFHVPSPEAAIVLGVANLAADPVVLMDAVPVNNVAGTAVTEWQRFRIRQSFVPLR